MLRRYGHSKLAVDTAISLELLART